MLKVFSLPFHPLRLPPPNSLLNQTVLVTGSNTGVGLETVRHALRLGAANVIMGVRSVSKGLAAREKILSSMADADEKIIEVWHLDLSSFQSVMAFARRVKEYADRPGGRLDVAIMNAGLASTGWEVSEDGWELQLQVNGLSTALLSLELLPVLVQQSTASAPTQKRRPPHLVIVSSDAHQSVLFPQRTAPNILTAMNDRTQWESVHAKSPIERYGLSKLIAQWINIELSKLVPVDRLTGKEKVIVSSATPGFCASELMRDEGVPWLLKAIEAVVARKPEVGARAIIDVAVREDGHGKWFENQKITEPGNIVTSIEGQKIREKAWKEIIEILRPWDPDLKFNY